MRRYTIAYLAFAALLCLPALEAHAGPRKIARAKALELAEIDTLEQVTITLPDDPNVAGELVKLEFDVRSRRGTKKRALRLFDGIGWETFDDGTRQPILVTQSVHAWKDLSKLRVKIDMSRVDPGKKRGQIAPRAEGWLKTNDVAGEPGTIESLQDRSGLRVYHVNAKGKTRRLMTVTSLATATLRIGPDEPTAPTYYHAELGLPSGGGATDSVAWDAALDADGNVCAGGQADYPSDTSPSKLRPMHALVKWTDVNGTPTLEVANDPMLGPGGVQEGRILTVHPTANNMAGDARTAVATPNSLPMEAITWFGNNPQADGSGSAGETLQGRASGHYAENMIGDKVGQNGDSVALLRNGSAAWVSPPAPAGSQSTIISFDISDNGVIPMIVEVDGTRQAAVCYDRLNPDLPADFRVDNPGEDLYSVLLPLPADALPVEFGGESWALCASKNGLTLGGWYISFDGVDAYPNGIVWSWNATTKKWDIGVLPSDYPVTFVMNDGTAFGCDFDIDSKNPISGAFASDSAYVHHPAWPETMSFSRWLEEVKVDNGFNTNDGILGGYEYDGNIVLSGGGVNTDVEQVGFAGLYPKPIATDYVPLP